MNSSAVYLGEGVWEGLVSLTGGFIPCSEGLLSVAQEAPRSLCRLYQHRQGSKPGWREKVVRKQFSPLNTHTLSWCVLGYFLGPPNKTQTLEHVVQYDKFLYFYHVLRICYYKLNHMIFLSPAPSPRSPAVSLAERWTAVLSNHTSQRFNQCPQAVQANRPGSCRWWGRGTRDPTLLTAPQGCWPCGGSCGHQRLAILSGPAVPSLCFLRTLSLFPLMGEKALCLRAVPQRQEFTWQLSLVLAPADASSPFQRQQYKDRLGFFFFFKVTSCLGKHSLSLET